MNLLINIDVDDLGRAIQFYTRAFALRVGRKFGRDGVELLGATAPIYLLVKDAGRPSSPGLAQQRHYGRHWTPVHLDIVVTDIDVAVKQAVAAGATLEQPIRSSNWGKLGLMVDPFGHGFCLVEFVGKGYDEIAMYESAE